MKLYKFRSLLDCTSVERVSEIFETGKFWCAPLWEQNDAMEAVYTSTLSAVQTAKFYSEKNRFRICSFSTDEALSDPRMWGYYAGGGKGVAIEVEVDEELKDLEKVKYEPKLPELTDEKESIRKVLHTKLNAWAMEKEYRFLVEGESGHRELGRISAVYFGNPYGSIDNQQDVVDSSTTLKVYRRRREYLRNVISKMPYKVHLAQANGEGTVTFEPPRGITEPES